MKTTNLADLIKPADFLIQAVAVTTVKGMMTLLNQLPIVSEHDYISDPANPENEWREGMLHWLPLGKDRGNAGRI